MSLTRLEFFSRIGLWREIDPLTAAAYDFVERLEREKMDIGAAARDPWHVSFHGSSFPGDDPYACGRAALYRMMGFPRPSAPRWLRQVADAGKDIEDRLCANWYRAGYLLTPPPWERYQKNYEDPETWLTCTVDSQLLHPKANRGVVCEVKSKYARDIEAMLKMCKGPDPKHVFQLKCQIGFSHEEGRRTVRRCFNTGRLAVLIGERDGRDVEVCPEHGHARCLHEETLEPIESGFIYYVSRDNPEDTWEFYYEYDADFMEAGRRRLKQWQKHFLDGVLPQTNFDDRRFSHPFGWQWTKPEFPCQYCDFGGMCREDHRQAVRNGKIIRLDECFGVGEAKATLVDYDIDLVRAAVLGRWPETIDDCD